MKPNSFILLLIILLSGIKTTHAQSQETDTAIAVVKYQFSRVMDSTNLLNIKNTEMILYMGKHSSLFECSGKRAFDSLVNGENGQKKASGFPLLQSFKNVDPISFYHFPATNKFCITESVLRKTYLMSDSLPVINWRIMNDSIKRLGNITCKKAVGSFRGRIYEVWFAPDIPLSYGPWKLSGLPGLILEAVDTKKHVEFKFLSLEKLNNSSIAIKLPTNVEVTTIKDFKKLKEAMANDPFTFLQNNMGLQITKPANFKPLSLVDTNPVEIMNK
jgi:GLPGLI family protein